MFELYGDGDRSCT